MIYTAEKIEEFKKYVEGKPKILKILKDNHRSYVFLFEYLDKKYVYKEPREKNRRKWQKFLSIFRGTESKREFFNIKKINESGVAKTVNPVYYTKQYLVYEYLEGNMPQKEYLSLVVEKLQEIHKAGYLHGDSQVENFLINNIKGIFIIDSKFKKNRYGKLGERIELVYLEKSTRDNFGVDILYEKKDIYYKIVILIKEYFEFFRKLKRIIRRK